MAKSTFGILLAIAGLVLVWSVVTGRLQKLASGDIVLSRGTGATSGTPAPASAPVTYGVGAIMGPPSDPQHVAAATSANQNLVSGGPYIPLGSPNYGIAIGGAHLGFDPLTGALA